MRQLPTTTRPPDVVFWSADKGGTRYYRCAEPARALELLGYRCQVAEVLCPSWGRSPTIVGHRVSSPKGTKLWQELAHQARRTGQQLVYDADDHYLQVDPSNEAAYSVYSRPEVQERIIANLRVAHTVTVCSTALAEVYGQYNDNVVVTTNTLPAAFSLWRRPLRRRLVVGWAGSEASHAELTIVAPVLRELARRDDVEVHLIGVPEHVARSRRLSAEQGIRVTPWVWGTEEYLTTVDFDIWIVPQRSTPFNGAKFPTKAMEASVLGIPIIASPVGEYPRRIGNAGVVAYNPTAWGKIIESMISNVMMRRDCAAAARHSAHQWYTEGHAQQWEKILIGR
jgi:hypothetical protein